VCPAETTLYWLGVDAGETWERREILISVADSMEPPPEEPVEVAAHIAADPDGISFGGCAMLVWEVSPPGDWTILLDGQQVAATGEREVCPTSTKTYELLVEAPGGAIVRNATLHVGTEPEEEPPLPAEPSVPVPGPAQGGADIQPTDLFPQRGTVWTRITNNGHDTLTNNQVEVTLSGCGAGKQFFLNIAPGQTQTMDTGCHAATGSHNYTVSVKSLDFTDPNPSNNSYSENLYWEAAPAPAAPGPTVPSAPGAPQPSAADLAITDLFPKTPQGPVYGRITNHGPASVSNLTVQFSCHWEETDPIEGMRDTGQIGPRNITITGLNPGQTAEFNTYISVNTRQFQYDMTCTIHPPSDDPNSANDSYSEKF
jgi:hypothetical protein